MPTIFKSKESPKSEIITHSFNSRLSQIFGYKAVDKAKAATEFEKEFGVRFVRVDASNEAYRIKNAALGSVYDSKPLASTLNKYFKSYLTETTLVYSDIAERQQRLAELRFAVENDPFLSRVCQLVADEATQLDDQNRLISIESPNPAFISRCYQLFAQWGITQQRIASVCYDLEQYGEALWSQKVTQNGVERIIPLRVPQLKERLEFSPAVVAERMMQLGYKIDNTKSRSSKIEKLLQAMQNSGNDKDNDYMKDFNENFADTFDTKLFGFEFDDDNIVPPWLITHFRYRPDNSEFFPYGDPPLIRCLAPFKRLYSSMALQGLARASSFPVQLYTVKNTEGVGVETAFETTHNVREEYENIGVTPSSNSFEVYSVNTKIWAPEGLLDLKILESKVDMDFVGDIELLEDQVAIASGVPKAYLDQEYGGFGNSGIALTEQYKPFGTHVYTIQSAFLQGLGELIRLHFAITGEFDYNTQFVLSMRFPAEEMSSDKRESRSASIDMAQSIVDMIKSTLGISDEDPLPEDVISDILSKYTFLDPTDLLRWIKLSNAQKLASDALKDDDEDGGDDDGGDGGFDFGGGGGGSDGDIDIDIDNDDGGSDSGDSSGGDDGGENFSLGENAAREYYLKTKQYLREKAKARKALKEALIRERWQSCKEAVYFEWLKENHLTEWKRPDKRSQLHELYVPAIDKNSTLYPMFEAMDKSKDESSNHLKEDISLKEAMEVSKKKYKRRNKDNYNQENSNNA